jgi:hypothetical protein
MVEVHHACHSGIKLVLVAIEELEWPIEEKAWPVDTSRTRFPFSGGPVKWGDAEFASSRAAVLGPQRENFGAPEQLTGKQQNPKGDKTGPRSGSVTSPID